MPETKTITVVSKAKAYVPPEPGMRPRLIQPGTTVVLDVEVTKDGPKVPRWAKLKEPKKRGPGRPPKQDEPKAEE